MEVNQQNAIQMINKIKETNDETSSRIDKTLSGLQETLQSLKLFDQKYDNFKKSFDQALSGMVQKMIDNMVPQHKKQEGKEYKFLPNISTLQQITDLIKKQNHILLMTGAGVSAASGIPTFRGADGFYSKTVDDETGLDPKETLTWNFYQKNPGQCWKWHHRFKQLTIEKKPNQAHYAIQEIFDLINKQKNKKLVFATQNIDGYHAKLMKEKNKQNDLKFGLQNEIYEIHGNINYMRCEDDCTDDLYQSPSPDTKEIIPKCIKCDKQMRPHILFFDETYNEKYYRQDSITKSWEESDCLIIIGTSIETMLTTKLVGKFIERNLPIIEINPNPSIEVGQVYQIKENAESFLPKLVQKLKSSKTK